MTRANEILQDPFNGLPINPNEPPALFSSHRDLGGGYGIWMGSQYMGIEQVGVLLTDPTDANGLGDDFDACVDMFSAVGYAETRSIRVAAQRPRIASEFGGVTMTGELVAHDDYLDTLHSVVERKGKTLASFSLEPGIDHPDLAGSMQAARDRAAVIAVEQDPLDADATLLKADIEYRNAWQWYGVGKTALMAMQKSSPTLLLVVGAEDGDIANKLEIAGAPNVVASFARPEYRDITEARTYPFAMRQGFIPGSAFRNAR